LTVIPRYELAKREAIVATFLAAYKKRSPIAATPTTRLSDLDRWQARPRHLRTRVLAAVFERADKLLESRGLVPLPRGLTTHKLRHAFARSWSRSGEDPILVMHQIGHTDPVHLAGLHPTMMRLDPTDREPLKVR
jgi:integrase